MLIAEYIAALEELWYRGYSLNADQAWITWNGQNVRAYVIARERFSEPRLDFDLDPFFQNPITIPPSILYI